MSKHGFGIFGTSVIAATHAYAIAAMPKAHRVAVIDVRPAIAPAFAEVHGFAAEPDLADPLSREGVEVVVVRA
jgi:predicted dehydrogenase